MAQLCDKFVAEAWSTAPFPQRTAIDIAIPITPSQEAFGGLADVSGGSIY